MTDPAKALGVSAPRNFGGYSSLILRRCSFGQREHRFGVMLNFTWENDDEIEAPTARMVKLLNS